MKEIISGKLPAVLNSPTPFALEFADAGCPDCKKFGSVVEHIANGLQDKVEVYHVDVDKVPEVRAMYEVRELPTMILFKDGKPQDRLIGFHSEQEVQDFLVQ